MEPQTPITKRPGNDPGGTYCKWGYVSMTQGVHTVNGDMYP